MSSTSTSTNGSTTSTYRMAYLTLFGDALPHPQGQVSPTRPNDVDVPGLTPGTPTG